MQLGLMLKEVKAKLKAGNIDTWRLDAELILMKATGFSRVQLVSRDDAELSGEQLNIIDKMLKRRLEYEPMQYILGRCEFMGLEFELNRDTLIPRGDTECLVELVLEYIKSTNANTVLDIGTGSGAIAVSLAVLAGLDLDVTAVDISINALDMAINNAKNNGVCDKIKFIESDLFANVNSRFDIIVSNPPYIESDVIPTLDSCVKDFEPLRALDGGNDGLDFYKKIINNAHNYLNSGGFIAFEIGYNQGEAVANLLKNTNFCNIKIGKDLAGLDRTVCGQLK